MRLELTPRKEVSALPSFSQTDFAAYAAMRFKEDGGAIRIIGDKSSWTSEGQPVIMAGNHRQNIEHIPLFGAVGMLGRTDLAQLALPGSFFLRYSGIGLAKYAKDLPYIPQLPVMPRTYAMENLSARERVGLFLKGIPQDLNQADIEEMNEASFEDAAGLVREGYAVNVFPTPSKPVNEGWRSGVGEVISRLEERARRETLFVPYFVTNIDVLGLFYSLQIFRPFGRITNHNPDFDLYIGESRSLHDLVGNSKDPKEITMALREYYFPAVRQVRSIQNSDIISS